MRFSRYPLPFGPVFASRVAEGAPPLPLEPLVSPAPAREERRAAEPYQLRVSGSKTVGVNVGSNRDLGLDQSLRVTMVGKVAKDLEVNAFLTDDNLPVQPEGNTKELKSVDKVSGAGEGEAHRGAARRLRIRALLVAILLVSAGAPRRRGRGQRPGAILHRERRRREGEIQDGELHGQGRRAGPLRAASARRFNAVIILPGTERVYFNGRQLKRGSENDYTIDYNRGTVTFMERLAVTKDSEIVIDYEMSEDSYERTTLTGGWTLSRSGGALAAGLFLPGVGRHGKLAFGSVGAADREVLEAAGDDPSKATTSGIERVEPGKGTMRSSRRIH